MRKPQFAKLMLCTAVALTLTACGGSDDDDMPTTPPTPPVPPPVVEAGDTIVLTASNKLVTFNLATAGTVKTNIAVTGLQANENLIGIDYRPADGALYGVGSTGRIYTINPTTGALTFKVAMSGDPTDISEPFTTLAGTDFGFDFNPAADRLRIVSNTGQSLRINVDTGATTTDGAINGGTATTALTAAGYTNSFAGTGNTQLFVIDGVNSTLYLQNPPNAGTLANPVPLGVTVSGVGGFDIDGRNNKGYAVLTVGGARNLYAIDLAATAGAATLISAIGTQEEVKSIALRAPAAPMVYGLTDAGRVIGFKPQTPGTLASDVAVTGLAAGEKLLGIDVRPKDGMMYGLTSTARIVTLDPLTGAATVKVTLVADLTDLTVPFGGITGTRFAVDFNPVADRLRVISDSGQSLRINVDTGNTITDGSINRAGATPTVSGAAYTNSFAGTTTTALFDIDTDNDSLALQSPPNDGTLAVVGALGLNVIGDVGMDIAGGANGMVVAALRTAEAGPSSLYRIDLVTGVATPFNGAASPALSAIGNGTVGVVDVAVSLK